jgi:hypothetical protein
MIKYVAALLLATSVGGYMVKVGVQHNTMQVFCVDPVSSECDFDYLYALFIFACWFVPFFILCVLVFLFLSCVKGMIKRLI